MGRDGDMSCPGGPTARYAYLLRSPYIFTELRTTGSRDRRLWEKKLVPSTMGLLHTGGCNLFHMPLPDAAHLFGVLGRSVEAATGASIAG